MINYLKKYIIPIVIVIVFVILCAIAVRSCQDARNDANNQRHNIEALNDSIHYWKTLSGQVVAEKKILIGDLDVLRLTNDSLANQVEELKLKKPTSVVYIKSEVIREKHDTTWIKNDSLHNYHFDFSDKWRELSGDVIYNDSMINMTIDKDVVKLDYIIAVDNGKAKITSSNPYIKMNEIQGLEIKESKKKRFHIGPYAGYGAGIHDNKVIVTPEIGIGLTYSLFGF